MKSIIITLTALAAAVMAQTTTTTNTVVTTTQSQTPLQTCLAKCSPTDVTCQAICVGVPHPGESQMNAVTDCVAKCDQGDGTKEATDKYGRCRDGCISSYIVTTGTAAPGGAYSTKLAPGQSSASASTTSSAGSSSSPNASAQSSSSSGMAAGPTGGARLGNTAGSLGLVFAAFVML